MHEPILAKELREFTHAMLVLATRSKSIVHPGAKRGLAGAEAGSLAWFTRGPPWLQLNTQQKSRLGYQWWEEAL
jgi:hypothetical protein